ncbi:MAG: protein kinase [Polyangiaceae bacterium]|nr:protein kinase [Polyangiaceae bacterium]
MAPASERPRADPVEVIEAIPVEGENEIPAAELAAELIPTPAGLRLFPELGRGVAGRIHPAFDRYLLRRVALKRLRRELAEEPFYRDGFIAEAQITGQLEHPNIVPVHSLALSPEGVPYFTMKLVEGVSLGAWLRAPARRPGTSERLHDGLEIFLKVCDAVAYAHDRGVVHRDLKPDNVMVAGFGQVYVMDWGLARLTRVRPASGQGAQMEAEGPVGTPPYMSPEQARGIPGEMDEQSDVFALGAILYQIVSGRLPYGALRDARQILLRARAGATVPIDEALGALPMARRIREIVTRALAPRKEDRYASVAELREDVGRFLRGGLHLPTRTCVPGEVVIREGEPGDAAYMITAGTCRAYRSVGGREETLATMTVGDVFGEMALVLYEPRAASVQAVGEVTLQVLDKQTLAEGLGIDGWTGALVRALAQRFSDLEQQVRKSGMRRE